MHEKSEFLVVDSDIDGNLVPRTSSIVDRKEALGTRLHQRKCTQGWKQRAVITVGRLFRVFLAEYAENSLLHSDGRPFFPDLRTFPLM